jgi:ATP adenylyltransferase
MNTGKPFALSGLPFANHVRRLALPSSATARREELETALNAAFLELCISTVRHAADYPPGAPSYNMLLMLVHMYVFSRRRDAHVLVVSGDQLGVNALGFAGFLLVKRPAELEEVVAKGPAEVLEGVGCESVHQVTGGPGLDGDIWIP